jgi:hypothetical protein
MGAVTDMTMHFQQAGCSKSNVAGCVTTKDVQNEHVTDTAIKISESWASTSNKNVTYPPISLTERPSCNISLCLACRMCFNRAPRHEGVPRTGSIAPRVLDLCTRSGWSVSRSFTPRERAPGTHWIGGWVGPRTVLEAVVKRKILSPRWESNPRIPIVQPIFAIMVRNV